MGASHKTIKLSAGHHRDPEHGACATELASILAGEPFSDHPASVCPVIAAFLRSYNDHVDDRRRQDLYPYAARALGTRTDAAGERRRARMCLSWARETCRPPPLHVRMLHRLLRCQGPDVDGVYAARAAAVTPGAHRLALAFLDTLTQAGQARDRSAPADARGRAWPFLVCGNPAREIQAAPHTRARANAGLPRRIGRVLRFVRSVHLSGWRTPVAVTAV
jgi:hypothetical protein